MPVRASLSSSPLTTSTESRALPAWHCHQATLGPVSARQDLAPRALSPSPAFLPPRFHSPARGPSLGALTADPSTFSTGPAPRAHPFLSMRSLPPGATRSLPAVVPGSPNVATTGWERGGPVHLSGFSLQGLLDGCPLRDASQHLAPLYVPLLSSQPSDQLRCSCPPAAPLVPTPALGTRALPPQDPAQPPGPSWTFGDWDGLRCCSPSRPPGGSTGTRKPACGWGCREPRRLHAAKEQSGHRVPRPTVTRLLESSEDGAPGERAETDETATATGLLRPVSTLCALGGCSLSRWTG
ncbi:unnamed protein product [Rangifer tarandus platyrhynchus]|uniref:Uncharacterized protein n=1 Tax=Rangifer tarandus platyrhynchus TaxID=3082113 RepID=A0AC59YQ45_RANTA